MGKCWNSDVDTGKNQILNFPEMDRAKGDVDKFSALKRLVDTHNLVKQEMYTTHGLSQLQNWMPHLSLNICLVFANDIM